MRKDKRYLRLYKDPSASGSDAEVYLFPFGTFVCWGVNDEDFNQIRMLIKDFERGERTEQYEGGISTFSPSLSLPPRAHGH